MLGKLTLFEDYLNFVLPYSIPIRLDSNELSETDVPNDSRHRGKFRELQFQCFIQGFVLIYQLRKMSVDLLSLTLQCQRLFVIESSLVSLLHGKPGRPVRCDDLLERFNDGFPDCVDLGFISTRSL